MASPNRLSLAAERSILLVAPDQADEHQLQRAANVSALLGADLQVYCPVVMPPTPHSWMTREMPPAVGQLGPARERGRRLACRVQASLNEKNVEAYAEAGICQSMTDGILETVARLGPGLVMYAKPRDAGLIDQPYNVQHDILSSRLDVPTWIVHPGRLRRDSIVGLVAAAPKAESMRDQNLRIGSAVARLADRSRSEAYLLACQKRVPALAMVREVMAPSDARVEQFHDDTLSEYLTGLASNCGIPDGHAVMRKGGARDELETLIETVQAGLVVTAGARRRGLGALFRARTTAELIELPCDLLVLSEVGFPYP